MDYIKQDSNGTKQNDVTIFIHVEQFPESFNVYDSLGEAYMKNGNKYLAVQNYKKSLELNPGNNNAEKMLKRLEEK